MSSKKPSKNNMRAQPARAPRPAPQTRRPIKPVATRVSTAALARSQGTVVPEPKFVSRTARSTRIVHSEAIASISGSTAFTVAAAYALNPGLAATFPWLSTQAVGWERYRFHKLRFVYYSRIGADNNGSFLFSPDYDAADPAPTTEDQATSYRGAVEAVPWTTQIAISLDPVSLLQAGPSKLVRTGALAANEDITLRDGGNLYVCTNSGAAIGWGKLWVEYDVELMLPQLVTVSSSPYGQADYTSNTITANTNLFGASTTLAGVNYGSTTGDTFTFSVAGTYLAVVRVAMGGTSTFVPSYTGTAVVSNNLTSAGATWSQGLTSVTIVAAVGSTLTLATTSTGATATNVTFQLARVA